MMPHMSGGGIKKILINFLSISRNSKHFLLFKKEKENRPQGRRENPRTIPSGIKVRRDREIRRRKNTGPKCVDTNWFVENRLTIITVLIVWSESKF